MPLNRREFVELGLGAVIGSQFASPLQAQQDSTRKGRLRSPEYSQVVMSAGIPSAQTQNSLEILAGFDDDALLKPYRLMGGLPAPGRDIGGWYEYLPD